MNEGITGSTVPRRQLGRHLRELRKSSLLSVRAAAAELEWSEAKIWRIETGQTGMRSLDVEAMCRVYGAPPDSVEALMALAKETKARGWWHSYGDVIPEGFSIYIGLEAAASEFTGYRSELMPGLLQTEDYARTLIRAYRPDVDEVEIERRVHLRMTRQVLLTRPTAPLTLRMVVNEAVLRRPVGGSPVMVRQLERLRESSELPTVSLRVIPFNSGLHYSLLSGSFSILRFPLNCNNQETEPPTVYVEGFTGELYLDKPHEIEHYTTAFTNTWESALDEAASQKLITQVARELTP